MTQKIEIKNELQNILSGKNKVSHGDAIQAALSYLRRSQNASDLAQGEKHYKAKETEKLIIYAIENNLLMKDINFNDYLSEGAEQRVFIKDTKTVYKLNDAIYYASWSDYFCNLLLNNYFFQDTAYLLKGFYCTTDSILYAMVEQQYVRATDPTDLEQVRLFLNNNGFLNTRNHDYYNPDLGIILEDLHDENVLTANDILYFIDTVFYVKPAILWK